MQVILLQRVAKLGQMGELVSVRDGYARNFLLPKQMAVRATKDNVADFESRKVQLEAHNLQLRQEAEKVASKMDGISVVIIRQAGESGHMYGSIRPSDISEAVTAKGFTMSREQVRLLHPIKMLGLHTVHVMLHPEVDVAVQVNVAKTEEEAAAQARAGMAPVVSSSEEVAAE